MPRLKLDILLVIFILLVSLFFKVYDFPNRVGFAHDGDLYSWIVRDIVVDKHVRLIGQQTTAPGIFIGPAFYYLLVPFFLVSKMDPIGAIVPIWLLGLATVFSYYWVFTRIFNKTVGIIISFLYAVLLSNVYFDSHIVPSTPTNLWVVWYFYTIIMISRGKYFVFPLLGLLVGLIWHIHIALVPVLAVIPLAMFFAKKLPDKKQGLLFFIALALPLIPLVLFEARHGFTQTASFFKDLTIYHGGGTGIAKFDLITIYLREGLIRLFLYPQGLPYIYHRLFFVLSLLTIVFVWKKKLIEFSAFVIFLAWIFGVVLYYSVSSVVVSEYYFASLEILFLSAAALIFSLIFRSALGKVTIIVLFSLVLVKNISFYVKQPAYKTGYNERKAVAEYIAVDARKQGFPCVAVSYITAEGENVGFRYFFWLNGLHVNQPVSGSPVYTIVLPENLIAEGISAKFGNIGVINPERVAPRELVEKSCSGQDSNLTDSMLNYTE